MGKVFISYSREDSLVADAVAKVLDDLGVEYFFDSRGIHWGDKITTAVRQALDECLAILVILSPSSLRSVWVPYEIGQADALQKRILPFLTDPSLEVPLYMRDLNFATTYDDIRTFFTSEFPMGGDEARRLDYEQMLFRDQFHNTEAAKRIEGIWYARWTRVANDGLEEYFEEDTLEVWTTRSRVRILGKDTKPGTPNDYQLVYYPMEGVVSEDGWIALSYWAGGKSRFCGTALLRRRGGGAARFEGHWRGFESEDYDEEPEYMAGRIVMARTASDLAEYCRKHWQGIGEKK